MIDGANPIQIFFQDHFPGIKAYHKIVAILSFMWTWNDFTMPLVFVK